MPSICSMKNVWLIGCFLGVVSASQAQLSPAVVKLQQYRLDSNTHNQPTPVGGTALYAEGGLHYLQPLYEYLKGADSGPEKNRLSRHLAYAGDHILSNYYNQLLFDSMMPAGYKDVRRYLDTVGKIQLTNARTWILNRAAKQKIVLFNENPIQLQQRAFFYTLLDDFYQLGFRYLSIYWLSPLVNPNNAPVNKFLGYQVADPIAAEIIRKAKKLGFTLIAYGDSSITKRTANVQDAVQATKLASLFQQDPTARVLVMDELAHISEQPIGDFTPMATVFHRVSGIDPMTVDLTELAAGSSFEYGRFFYEELIKKIPVEEPSLVVRNQEPISLLENDQYDLQVLFPPTKPLRNRAAWLTLSGSRREVAVQPTHRELFFVQAYYTDETLQSAYANLIPADQTYLTDRDGYYWLFLAPGKYKLVLRDIHYNMLSEKDLVVEQ